MTRTLPTGGGGIGQGRKYKPVTRDRHARGGEGYTCPDRG